jgi:hypothetical protein
MEPDVPRSAQGVRYLSKNQRSEGWRREDEEGYGPQERPNDSVTRWVLRTATAADGSSLQVLRGMAKSLWQNTAPHISSWCHVGRNCGCYSLLFNQRDKARLRLSTCPTRQTAQQKWSQRIPHDLHAIHRRASAPPLPAPAGDGRANGGSFSSSDAFSVKGAVADRLDVRPQPSFNIRSLTARWRFEFHSPRRDSCVLQPLRPPACGRSSHPPR